MVLGTYQPKMYRWANVLYNCNHCQMQYSRSPAHKGEYCSRACFAEIRYKPEMRICPRCGGVKSQGSKGFCIACRPISLTKGKKVPCLNCAILLHSTPSKPRKFCNFKCLGEYRTGSNNPAYVDGKAQVPYSSQFRTVAKEVRAREGKICFLCSSVEKLDVHHIDRDISNNTMGNLIALCRLCHARQRGTPEQMIELSNQLYLKLHHRYCYPILSIT